ncbi:Fructose-bisphosphate aldolase 3, chloroplastic [Linum perenne]
MDKEEGFSRYNSKSHSELEATLNQSPNPWHVSFSYAPALQNSVLKTWKGRSENVEAAQKALLVRAKANSLAQLGKYSADGESRIYVSLFLNAKAYT